MKKIGFVSAIALALASTAAIADIKEKLETAMASDVRTEAEVKRDANRRPIQTLEFFGLEEDMTVIELIPGGGWYTKILAPALAEKGKYYAAIAANGVEERLSDQPGFERMNITGKDAQFSRDEGSYFSNMELDSLGVTDADMVLTFRNYHNLSDSGRETMNRVAFDALKPGGIYGVIDHTGRHMEPLTPSNRRRFDPVKAIKEIQAAGFVLVDYSTLHYKEDDELEYEVGARSVQGATDRFTLKFMKPE